MARPQDARRRAPGHRHTIMASAIAAAALAVAGFAFSAAGASAATTTPSADPHVPSTIPANSTGVAVTADNCAMCHRAHTGAARTLLPTAGPESELCLTCHNGTGASTNVLADFSQPNTVNNPATGSYYRHDATVASKHTLALTDEFAGVLNRHADCGDCHNPHQSHGTNVAAFAINGWTPSYRLAGISGVSVTNGAAGTAPTYTFQAGNEQPITYEYELCLKCHSSHTILLTNDPVHPSWDMLDAGAEFNPANASFHPVEAAGKNQSAAMTASLQGTSPYKLWTFSTTGTVRCTHCHADGVTVPGGPAADANLPTHASVYRGMLTQNYEDRVLNSPDPTGANPAYGYAPANFALCYLCHADSPFVPGGPDSYATNFVSGTGTSAISLHRLHVAGIGVVNLNFSGGTDIDTPGAGNGNALCAECHFRPHSTVFPTGGQATNTAHLVSFSPNVLPLSGTSNPPSYTVVGSGGTCSLTCHGFNHSAVSYP